MTKHNYLALLLVTQDLNYLRLYDKVTLQLFIERDFWLMIPEIFSNNPPTPVNGAVRRRDPPESKSPPAARPVSPASRRRASDRDANKLPKPYAARRAHTNIATTTKRRPPD